MKEVQLADPKKTNLLAMFLQSLLKKALENPALERRANNLEGTLLLESGAMKISIHFGNAILIERGNAFSEKARIQADLPTLLSIARGASPLVAWLRGHVRFSGNLWFLFTLLPIFQSAGKPL